MVCIGIGLLILLIDICLHFFTLSEFFGDVIGAEGDEVIDKYDLLSVLSHELCLGEDVLKQSGKVV